MEENLENTNIEPTQLTDEQLANKIMQETDSEKSKQLIDLFNFNIKKKNALRVLKLSGLMDEISDEMQQRIANAPYTIEDNTLSTWLNTVEKLLKNTSDDLKGVEELPTITPIQQNNQVNINVIAGLDRDSRERVLDAVKFLLKEENKQ